MFTGKIRFFI
uniref:Uncharacterized protein n=1 Tax=Romanomermis culicivorax TaxID=13658 RepID=A0A915JSD1_ROMCU